MDPGLHRLAVGGRLAGLLPGLSARLSCAAGDRMLKYIVYTGVAALIVWAAAYLIYRFHQRLRGKRGCGCGGGGLLGCRESAKSVLQKFELASCSRSDSGLLKNNADFRQPRISSPPAESGDRQHTPHGLAFQGGRVVWLLGSWMSYQCYAVLKYKQC